jgi:hypothetical protein
MQLGLAFKNWGTCARQNWLFHQSLYEATFEPLVSKSFKVDAVFSNPINRDTANSSDMQKIWL